MQNQDLSLDPINIAVDQTPGFPDPNTALLLGLGLFGLALRHSR